jgi:16S rRNA (cytosine967-C5)-methyltransferase
MTSDQRRKPARRPALQPRAASAPRLAAAQLISAVVHERSTLDAAFASAPAFGALEGRDRAFAAAVARAALRAYGPIRAALDARISRPLTSGAELADALLIAGAAEIGALKAPAHAVVNEAVAAARTDRKAGTFAGLINAVLRRLAEAPDFIDAAPDRALVPPAIFTRWRAAYGEANADAIASSLRKLPPLDLTVTGDPSEWREKLGATALGAASIRLPADAGEVSTLPGYADGAWWVQDAAAALPARLLGVRPGETVADICAAPGGKTLQLAAAGAQVTAVDVAPGRLARLRENLERCRLSAQIVTADAAHWATDRTFDAVLVDAPCSATGTCRRQPEVLWRLDLRKLPELVRQQTAILANAARLVRSGGRLVYAVCSLEPEEGEGVIAGAAGLGLTPEPVMPNEVDGYGEMITAQGFVRVLPHHAGGRDGFFIARFVKA